MQQFFNHRFHLAENSWQRREFLNHWWQIYRPDPRWVPPPWADLLQTLAPERSGHLARMEPLLLYGEALPRQARPSSAQRHDLSTFSGSLFEAPVAAGLLLRDPRRQDGAAYAVWPHIANDGEVLVRFLDRAAELLQPLGIGQLILPVGLSPHLGSGSLQDYFHQLPPLHTPYDPPYLPELLAAVCRPLGRSLLYNAGVAAHLDEPVAGPATLQRFELHRLAGDLLPLFAQTMPVWAGFPPPDALEASFLISWIGRWPHTAWLATVDGQPVGFVLLQPDLSPLLRQNNGGRRLWQRLWMAWRSDKPTVGGRILFGGVAAGYQRLGIGRQLWQQALHCAAQAGWQTLSYGPVPSTAPANDFLQAQGLEPQRTYLLHRYEFS